MNHGALIVSIIAVIGALVLATRAASLRRLGMARAAKLAAVWALIIVGLMVVIQLLGLRTGG